MPEEEKNPTSEDVPAAKVKAHQRNTGLSGVVQIASLAIVIVVGLIIYFVVY